MKRKIVIIISTILIFSGIIFVEYKYNFSINFSKLKGDVNASSTIEGAMFLPGDKLNVKMKKLANGNIDDDFNYKDKSVNSIKRSTTLTITPTEDNIVSTSDSTIPIYMWFDNGTIYYYTEYTKPYLNYDSSYMFFRFINLTNLDLSSINASNVKKMYYMFAYCESLTTLNLSSFNTNNVTDMDYMFYDCKSLTTLDLNNFDTSNVKSMRHMFENCENLTTLNISKFNTSNVTNMESMFYNCKSLVTLNLSHFNTSKVTNMTDMFRFCTKLITLDLSNFDTSKITNMGFMFYNCNSLTTLNLSNFNTSNVTNMESMFSNCESLTTLNISSFDTSNVTNMWGMFALCYNLTSLDLSHFNTSKVTNMTDMFRLCTKLTTLNLNSFNTSNVTKMGYMFFGCRDITLLNISSFNTSNVTNMTDMFKGCASLTTLDLSHFNTSKVTTMYAMFDGCTNLMTLNLSSFNTSNVTTMRFMFANCSVITALDLSHFNTSKVIDMWDMFNNCKSLMTLNLSSFDTSNVTNMGSMFKNCENLTKIYASSKFITIKVTNFEDMFYRCTKLVGEKGTKYNSSKVDKTYARIDGGTSNPGYFSVHKVYIKYHVNGGTLSTTNNIISTSGSLVTVNGSTNAETINYGETLPSSGLANYNNPNYINITRSGYTVKEGEEWNTKSDGTGKTYDQTTAYKASDLCDASKNDCEVTLYVNWKKIVNIPTCSDKTYTGSSQTLMNNATGYTVSNNIGTEMKNYEVTLSLTNGYIWSDKSVTTKSVTCKIIPVDISKLTIKNNNNVMLNINDTKKTITDALGTTSGIKVLTNNSEIKDTTKLKTRDILNVNNTNYTIVIKGDIASNGKIDISDVAKLYSYITNKNKYSLTEVEKLASDYAENDKIEIQDVAKLYNEVMKGVQ